MRIREVGRIPMLSADMDDVELDSAVRRLSAVRGSDLLGVLADSGAPTEDEVACLFEMAVPIGRALEELGSMRLYVQTALTASLLIDLVAQFDRQSVLRQAEAIVNGA